MGLSNCFIEETKALWGCAWVQDREWDFIQTFPLVCVYSYIATSKFSVPLSLLSPLTFILQV